MSQAKQLALAVEEKLNLLFPGIVADEYEDDGSISYLKWMCAEIIKADSDDNKWHRWIGYVQRALIENGCSSLSQIRDETRAIIQSITKDEVSREELIRQLLSHFSMDAVTGYIMFYGLQNLSEFESKYQGSYEFGFYFVNNILGLEVPASLIQFLDQKTVLASSTKKFYTAKDLIYVYS